MPNNKYLVYTSKGSKYYQNINDAFKEYTENPTAHSIAIWKHDKWNTIPNTPKFKIYETSNNKTKNK